MRVYQSPRSHETTGAAIRSKIMMMPSSAYPHVKSFASGDVGVKSPNPTVVAVTVRK